MRAWAIAIVVSMGACVVVAPRPVAVARAAAEPITFYETLAPYGEWIVVAEYGRVWRPHVHVVGAGFVPYFTGGSWVHTESGWAFTAQWEWAWLPFHYGRWYDDGVHGWLWVPGTVWAPAWVEWRTGGGYIGWMPLGPPHHRAHRRWCYVETRHFVARDLHQHRAEAAAGFDLEAATAPIPPPTGHAVYSDEPAWTPGPPVAALRAEAIDVPEQALRRPPPVSNDRVFPRDLPPPAAARRAPVPEPEPRQQPAPAPVPVPDRRWEPRPQPAPVPMPAPDRRWEPRPPPAPVPMPAPDRRLEPRPLPAPVPMPAPDRRFERTPSRVFPAPVAPVPPAPGTPTEDPRKRKKQPAVPAPVPGQPGEPAGPVRSPPGV